MNISQTKPGDPIAITELVKRVLMGVNTAIPGIIQTFNADDQTAEIQPAIRAMEIKVDGTTKKVALPLLVRVPVLFPYCASLGLSMTYPVKQDDQCLIIFSQRGIDNWLDYGGLQDPIGEKFPRAHSLSDGIAIVGLIPKTQKIASFQTDAIEIRNSDRSSYIKLNSSGNINAVAGTSSFQILKNGNIELTAPTIIFNGTVQGSGTGNAILTTNGVQHSSKVINSSHAHSGVTGGTGNSGGVA